MKAHFFRNQTEFRRWLEIDLGNDDLARLDEIWPGHKPAPEDYAW